jgi:hypothetical protein
MSLWSRIKASVGAKPAVDHSLPPGTGSVESGRSEDTGGVPDPAAPDQHSTTGTTPNDTFVGRAAGDDAGYLETGAEKRAAEDGDASAEDRP